MDFQRFQRKRYTAAEYAEGIRSGNRALLSQAITLVESTLPAHQELAQDIIARCMPHRAESLRVGITGTPGVGKSTFIEAFGNYLLDTQARRLAVLAIDPSSQLTKGSILGDKTRMQRLSMRPEVFIRPTAAGVSLGGVAHKTRETILLCEAAGFDTIFVETVGVGQSETLVQSMTDFFLLLLLPNSGDELQGIKRGVMEMADLVVIHKADGEAVQAARLAQKQCINALHLFPPKPSGWAAGAVLASSVANTGLDSVWERIAAFAQQTRTSGYFAEHRAAQSLAWLRQSIEQQLLAAFYQHPAIAAQFPQAEQSARSSTESPTLAARKLVDIFLQRG